MENNSEPDPWDVLVETAEEKERVVVEYALGYMVARGWLEDEPDRVLLEALRRLYAENPLCQVEIVLNGEVLHDLAAARPGEHLALLYEQECNDHWEREEAERWSCPCGFTFGIYPWAGAQRSFYTLTDDGLFDRQVERCPRCDRDLAKARRELAEGQLGFAF